MSMKRNLGFKIGSYGLCINLQEYKMGITKEAVIYTG